MSINDIELRRRGCFAASWGSIHRQQKIRQHDEEEPKNAKRHDAQLERDLQGRVDLTTPN
ncbi:MAG TPA: hypothetical protein VED84_05915 [Acidimicrobiales bacterium]|nr:hypothetical protein [Acidimicrobiales bacterium]